MRVVRWLPVVAAALILLGCGQTRRPTPDSTLELTPNNTLITLKPHETFAVTLPSNQSTGYYWELAGGDIRILLPTNRYVPPKTSRPRVAGKEVWRFWTVRAGSTQLRLTYVRGSQPNKPVLRFGVMIHVR
jgi:predicted secreted protein